MTIINYKIPKAQRGGYLPSSQINKGKEIKRKLSQRLYKTIQPGLYPNNLEAVRILISDFINNRDRTDLVKTRKEYSDLSKELKKADDTGNTTEVNILLNEL